MKHTRLIPTLLSVCLVSLVSCDSITPSEALLSQVQNAARNCTAMEWCAVQHNDFGMQIKQLRPHRVSAEDMEKIRHLILEKMFVIKYSPGRTHFTAFPYFGSKHLRFLGPDGKVIYDYQPDTVCSGYAFTQCLCNESSSRFAFSGNSATIILPDEDFKTWEELQPAQLEKEVERCSNP